MTKVLVLVLLSAALGSGSVLNRAQALSNSIDISMRTNRFIDEPPNRKEYAKVARYIVHKSQWTSMGTLSTLNSISGYPMVNIISVADSPRDAKSTGHIYFLLTDLDFTGQDLSVDNKLTALFSNDQDLECTNQNVDPMEPICGRVMISGQMKRLPSDTKAYQVANEAFLSRHPAANNWIRAHDFYLCELDIQQIAVLNYYGGPHYVTPEDYYKADFDADEDDTEEYAEENQTEQIDVHVRETLVSTDVRKGRVQPSVIVAGHA